MAQSTKMHAPDSLLGKWRLLGSVVRSEWATSLDKTVAYEIIERYRDEHQNSRASISYLEAATGATRKSIIASLRRLTEHGPFSIERIGIGTRPTEYRLHFELNQNARSGAESTTAADRTSGVTESTPRSVAEGTPTASSSGACSTQSLLPVASDKRGLQVEGSLPTHAPGLTAGAAWQEEGFEKLWRAYGVRTEKAKSRAAFERTIKTPEQFERAVSSAEVWAASAPPAKGGPRMSLAAWLLGERYDEDPPSARWKKNKTGAVSRQAAEEAADKSEDNTEYSEDQSAESAYAPRVWPRTDNLPLGQSRLSVSSAEIDDIDGNKVLRLFYDGTTGPAEGRQFTHSISIVHRDFEEQAHGQKVLAEVCRAVGLAMIEDAEELYRREFDVSVTTDNLLFLFPDQARTLH